MEYKKFSFDPEEGFLDEDFYEETPENSREILQRQHFQTRDYINLLVDTLNSDKEGKSGSESIKSPEIDGVSGNNVYEQLKDIKKQINESMEGVIPDGSVTEIKLSNNAVTERKIGVGAVTTEKMAENTIAPYANEVININGISKEKYLPVSHTGSPSFLKELFAKDIPSDLYGKYFNNKRYMFKDNLLYTLDMDTGEFEKVSDFKFPDNTGFIPGEGDFIYAYLTKDSSDYVYIHIAKYLKEYDVAEEIRNFKIFSAARNPKMLDIFIMDGYLYIGTVRANSSHNYNYIYKIPEEDIKNGELTVFYSEETDDPDNAFFSVYPDIILGDIIFKNADTNNIIKLKDSALCEDTEGNIFTDSTTFPIIDKETYLPKCANLNTIKSSDCFLYKNYIYVLIENYLFRTKLF